MMTNTSLILVIECALDQICILEQQRAELLDALQELHDTATPREDQNNYAWQRARAVMTKTRERL